MLQESALIKRQRLRSLLREGVHAHGLEGEAGSAGQLDWMAELIWMPVEEVGCGMALGEGGTMPVR